MKRNFRIKEGKAMFEDFKDKICQQKLKDENKPENSPFSPEVLEKLRERGIDPENVTLPQLFTETLDPDGNDISLMSGAEWEIMTVYAKTRKYLLENYPQSQEEAKMLRQSWEEEPKEPYQINIAKEDPQRKVFVKTLFQMKRKRFMTKWMPYSITLQNTKNTAYASIGT
jgi:hypothetical protein